MGVCPHVDILYFQNLYYGESYQHCLVVGDLELEPYLVVYFCAIIRYHIYPNSLAGMVGGAINVNLQWFLDRGFLYFFRESREVLSYEVS